MPARGIRLDSGSLPDQSVAQDERSRLQVASERPRETGMIRLTRAVFCFLAAAAGLLITAGAWAQTFPTNPITLIVPWPPGGSTDIVVRAMADVAGKQLGQPVVVDNRAGASGTLGPS